MGRICPEIDDQQSAAWRHGLSRTTEQLNIALRHKHVHNVREQNHIVALRERILQEVSFHDFDSPFDLIPEVAPSNACRCRQLIQSALQLWIALRQYLQKGTSPTAQVQNAFVLTEIVCGCQSQSMASGESLHTFRKDLLFLHAEVEFARDALSFAD